MCSVSAPPRTPVHAKEQGYGAGVSVLDDEWEMIRLFERIGNDARMLDENVPGWWRVPEAVDRIMASKLCDHVDEVVHGLPARPLGVPGAGAWPVGAQARAGHRLLPDVARGPVVKQSLARCLSGVV